MLNNGGEFLLYSKWVSWAQIQSKQKTNIKTKNPTEQHTFSTIIYKILLNPTALYAILNQTARKEPSKYT